MNRLSQKERNFLAAYFAVTVFFLIFFFGAMTLLLPARADNVLITGTVTESVACTSAGSPTFSSITISSVATADVRATTTLSCNSANGCSLTLRDQGDGNGSNGNGAAGLYKSVAPTDLIDSTSTAATTTLAAGVDGFGLQAFTSTAGSGAGLTVVSRDAGLTGDIVGNTSTTNITVASGSSPLGNREFAVVAKTAVYALTRSGTYTDTLIYACTAN